MFTSCLEFTFISVCRGYVLISSVDCFVIILRFRLDVSLE